MRVGDHTSSVIRPAAVGGGGASAAAVVAAAAAGAPVALSSGGVAADEGGDVELELELVMGTGRLLETGRTGRLSMWRSGTWHLTYSLNWVNSWCNVY